MSASSAAPQLISSAGPRPFKLDEPIGFRVVASSERHVCVRETNDWKMGTGVAELFPAVDAKAFASVHAGVAARLMITPEEDRIVGVLEAEHDGIFVRGWIIRPEERLDGGAPSSPFPLFISRPLPLGGVFFPKPSMSVTWWAKDSQLFVEPAFDVGVTLSTGSLRSAVSCGDLSLDMLKYDTLVAVAPTKSRRTVFFGKAKTASLMKEPGGPVVAGVRLEAFRHAVVLGEKDAHTKVALENEHGFAVGWVKSDILTEESDPLDGLGGLGLSGIGAGGGGRGRLQRVDYVCPHDVRLLIDQTDRTKRIAQLHRYVVGGYRAGATIKIAKDMGERTVVTLPGLGTKISFHFDQLGMVFSSELRKCREVASSK